MRNKRRFILGDEWIYLKIYSGPVQLERILLSEIYEIVEQFFSSKMIDKFFFVRYFDNGFHLRCRFHVTKIAYVGGILTSIAERLNKYVENRIVSKVVWDTYNREIERYGLIGIEQAETFFCVNSLQVLYVLKHFENYEDRVFEGVKSTDLFLSRIGLSYFEKQELFEFLHESYASEFLSGKQQNEILKARYREWGKKIADLILNNAAGYKEVIRCPDFILLEYESVIDKLSGQIARPGLNKNAYYDLLRSLLHMHFNRLFRTKQRSYEFVIYYLLNHTYKSVIARINLKN